MKSQLTFIDHETGALSDCGQVLDIEHSNQGLGWSGVVIEKGSSPHFYPQNVHTPYFYFALALEQDLNWEVEKEEGTASLKTSRATFGLTHPKRPLHTILMSRAIL
ncbi:hypothetical protein JCM19240_4863 [Vibrio maritimus]|uniref:Uncharacterized protein n=1 Tax=Vibrio maritimus TaxID=990268 RepID=A0A090T9K0_9VIBR|nr:hypothetical protein JCM19240_4863 [Vibrio maritimus]